MLRARVLAVAAVLALPSLATAGALELDFGSSDAQSPNNLAGSHLDVAAEVPLNTDLAFGFTASSNHYDRDGTLSDTLVLGVAPAWKVSDDLRMSLYYEHAKRSLEAGDTEAGTYGVEAGYGLTDSLTLSGYLSRYDGASDGLAEGTNLGASARVALGTKTSVFAFVKRDTSGDSWWEDRGAGLDRRLAGRGLGLSMRYTERDSAAGGAPERTLFFGGTITVGSASGSAPEFRGRHCVVCTLPD